jgi:hypothetical protein
MMTAATIKVMANKTVVALRMTGDSEALIDNYRYGHGLSLHRADLNASPPARLTS